MAGLTERRARPGTRRLTVASLGAWLLKGDPRHDEIATLLGTGFAGLGTRCVRPSYRTELVAAGQPVLYWVSGRDPLHPAGLHGQGTVTGPVHVDPDLGPVLPLHLAPVAPPVLRAELLAHPVLADLEVLRMPAGSNPSYVTGEQLAALRAGWPQVD
ncbi:hypothetical protein ASG49_13820 [Marmoricola sp. Leaf446]|uniref:hypothetical protein n=1 Tax=Marmoricola sp. Leaf446 TaxID=1736379 RepID=UPI0006F99EF1|nr:hypothetical protein [Marmoricola sp. Leaf446]KQT90813.1 hypothetical protein ASG49_13820 [Marmoricola sp. Leaf446]